MTSFDNIKLEKGLYTTGKSFTEALEKIDPSENYKGTSLEGLDAFQRQLKRFDIKVSGKNSDSIEKFFRTTDSAALFPEYVSRAVKQGIESSDVLSSLIATTTNIDGLDYRTISADTGDKDKSLMAVNEGSFIPETTISTKENLVKLYKRGRMLSCSYEAIKFQRLDLFTITLKQIGAAIARSQMNDAINVLINGDGNNNAAAKLPAASGTVSYDDLLSLWLSLYPYQMTTLIASPELVHDILQLDEFKDAHTSDYKKTGRLATPFGANLICHQGMEEGTLLGFDKNYSLEKIQAGPVITEFDKLIDRQIERAAITSTVGFAKIFNEASRVMTVTA